MADKRFIKGLFKDTGHIDQPEGSWRYALNAHLTEIDGAVTNEGGTKLHGIIPVNFLIIGEINIGSDKVILFLKDYRPATAAITPRSEIGIYNTEEGSYETLLNLNINTALPGQNLDLNFNLEYRIEGTFKVNSKGETVIYFTDDLNPPRTLNITRQSLSNSGQIYGLSNIANNPYYVESLNLFPHAGDIPHITVEDNLTVGNNIGNQNVVLEGGGLLTGVYYLALAYVDKDFVATNFVTVSNPISIVDEFDHTRPTYKKDGAKDGVQTSKSIKWNVSNLNPDYSYVRPVVVRKMGDAIDAYRLNDIDNTIVLNSGISFSGVEGYSKSSIDDIIIDTVSYDTAKTINQLDGVLYLGNLTSKEDLGFQKYANNIKVNSVTKNIAPFDEEYYTLDSLQSGYLNSTVDSGNVVDHTKSYRYQPNIFKYKGYKRDEVYAFYIAFILTDGSMSYAYHIPGRTAELIDWYNDADYAAGSGLPAGSYNESASPSPGDFRELSPSNAKLFHFWDSSVVNQGSNSDSTGSCRHMNFWQNASEFYPDTPNYDIRDKDGFVGSLQGLNVRHNHFPSNENPDRKSVTQITNHHEYDNTEPYQSVGVGGATKGAWSMDEDPAAIEGGDFHAIAGSDFAWTSTTLYRGILYGAFLPLPNANLAANWGGTDPATGEPFGSYNAWRTWARNEYMNVGSSNHKNNKFTATANDTLVWVKWQWGGRVAGGSGEKGRFRLATIINGVTSLHYTVPESDNAEIIFKSTGSSEYPAEGNAAAGSYNPSGAAIPAEGVSHPVYGGAGWHPFLLPNPGDSVDLRARAEDPSDQSQIETSEDYHNGYLTIAFEENYSSTGGGGTNVKVSHQIEALGFDLEDIHIPRSIANKIQGFKIYYAKREHSNKTILGQSIVTPQFNTFAVLGICSEASSNDLASQTLQTLSNLEESFFENSAFAKNTDNYEEGYKQLAFYDFNLLRSKNSIAPATHIKVQYGVYDYTWNGPSVEQEKQSLTELTSGGDGVLSTSEVWTNNSDQNCYVSDVRSALFVGRNYIESKAFYAGAVNSNRILGQKAKSYVNGDSIFNGQSLGLSKILNLYGESHIALGLKDNHYLPAISTKQNGNYGEPPELNEPATILNNLGYFDSNNQNGHLADNGAGANNASSSNNIHESYIVDLKAFKSDVYKSIDSQQLIWTGFEVVGSELENFVFDSEGMTGTGNTADLAGFGGVNNNHEGIFGGDIFICRYGVTKTLSPLYSTSSAGATKAVYSHIVESVDNINFRHSESDDSLYFPGTHFKGIIEKAGLKDYNSQDNLKYNKNYSEINDLRTAIPLPVRDVDQTDYPTRTHRSAKNDTTSLIDNYRTFLANQFKDLPRNRGELWKLATFSNLLYFHMEDSLYKAKGKQSMKMNDGSDAFVGSGDIFQQEPDEVVQSSIGYGGTQSQWAAITTKAGYFFVDKNSRKVFIMRDQLTEISANGMEHWFRDNMKFELEEYVPEIIDNPLRVGFHSTYDSKYKRIILTKRDLKPTSEFTSNYYQTPFTTQINSQEAGNIAYDKDKSQFYIYGGIVNIMGGGSYENPRVYIEWDNPLYFSQTGWTISYFPELNIWVSFHSYVPYIYFNSATNFYSANNLFAHMQYLNGFEEGEDPTGSIGPRGLWEHNSKDKGLYYIDYNSGSPDNFELEFIDNSSKTLDKVYSSFDFTLQTFKYNSTTGLHDLNVLDHGFTSFYIYNTHQIDTSDLKYMVNTRKIGNEWKVNKFRDQANITNNVSDYYTPAETNILGGVSQGTTTTLHNTKMFTLDDAANYYAEIVNNSYINPAKAWNLQKKFVDKWVGIRLICSNSDNKMLNLYATNVASRKFYR